jgi:hypothetical protein
VVRPPSLPLVEQIGPPTRRRRRTERPDVGLTGARFGGAAGRRSRAAAEPAETNDAGADRPVGGLTGARFGGAAGRRSRAAAEPTEIPDASTGLPAAPCPSTARRGWDAGQLRHQALQRLGTQAPAADPGSHPHAAPARPATRRSAATHRTIGARVGLGRRGLWADSDTFSERYELVRPYSWTGGRTTSCVALAMETLISATGRPADPAAAPEHHTIVQLCATSYSVAELAALLQVPLGVVRVLLGDLAAAGSIAIHHTVGSTDAASDVALMQRVLAGLHRL